MRLFLLQLVICMLPGEMVLTNVIMAGWQMAVCAIRLLWQESSVVEVYLEYERYIALRIKLAFLTQIANLMHIVLNVRIFDIYFKNAFLQHILIVIFLLIYWVFFLVIKAARELLHANENNWCTFCLCLGNLIFTSLISRKNFYLTFPQIEYNFLWLDYRIVA